MIPAPPQVARLHDALARLDAEATLAVAISGGPDSLALLLLAAAARPGAVIAATVDHRLRPEAAGEACFVAGVCARLDVPHAILAITVADDPAGPQAAARRARYDALEDWALAAGAGALATAHHLDDQAETVLMRLARGAGVGGLRGIRASRSMRRGLKLVRPLLDWRRSELAAMVEAAGLTAVDDPSNRDPRYDRTGARQRLAAGWPDPARLAAVAAHMADADDALRFTADRLLAERFVATAGGATLELDDLPREYRRRLLIGALGKVLPGNVLRGDAIDRLLDRLATGRISTLAGVRVAPGPPLRLTVAPPRRTR